VEEISQVNKVTNEEVLQQVQEIGIPRIVQQRKHRWIGHVFRRKAL